MSMRNIIKLLFNKFNPKFDTSIENFTTILNENQLLKSNCKYLKKDLYALNDRYQQLLISYDRSVKDFQLLLKLEASDSLHLIKLLARSKSQLRQDIMVLAMTDFKRDGFFVEFGACDGIIMSNSYLLETDFGWRGILSEPAHIWHHNLKNNRTAIIDFRCIWSKTGEYIKFNEVDEAGLSTINLYTNVDCHSNERLNGELYDVPTISLMDLLIEHSAPSEIDYLSIDTEGSEYDILSSIDFSKYKFKIITCEHNYSPNRELIYDLLTKNGYVRFLTEESQFDDWYFFPNLFTASK